MVKMLLSYGLRIQNLATLFIGIFLLLPAAAETFYWAPDSTSSEASFVDLNNWSTVSATGEAASALPGTEDTIAHPNSGTMHLNMGNDSYDVGALTTVKDKGGTISVHNGTLRFTGTAYFHTGSLNLKNSGNLVFASGSLGRISGGPQGTSGGGLTIDIQPGSKFLVENGGMVEFYYPMLTVNSGGSAEFCNPEIKLWSDGWKDNARFTNNGDFRFPNGATFTPGTKDSTRTKDGVVYHQTFTFYQKAGTMIFGGDVDNQTKSAHVNFAFEGGLVEATENVAFRNTSVSIPANGNVTFNVANGKTLDISGISVAETAVITKTGAGFLGFSGIIPAGLSVTEGGVTLLNPGTYDFSQTTFAAGSQIRLANAPITLTGSISESVSFTVADWEALPKNVVFIRCEDTTLLDRIYTDLSATKPNTIELTKEGTGISASVLSSYIFSATGTEDWNVPSAWLGGVVPPAGADVFIQGENVTAIFTESSPVPASITISRGATLSVQSAAETALSLPHIFISGNSTFAIANGTAALGNGLSSTATAEALPELSIAAGATLQINQAAVLKNIALTVNGTLEQLEPGHLTLGTAAAGETAFFELTGDGAIFLLHGSANQSGASDLRIACPEESGIVKVSKTMTLNNFRITITDGPLGMQFGVNNPLTEPLRLECRNSTLLNSGYMTARPWTDYFPERANRTNASSPMKAPFVIAGAATLVLGEGCLWEQIYNAQNNSNGGFDLRQRGQFRIEAGAVYNQYHTAQGISLNPDEENFPSVVVADGGILQMGPSHGNGKGRYQIENGTIRLMYTDGWETYKTTLFSGAKEVYIPEGKTATFCGVANHFRELDKKITCNAPFAGGGNLLITNAYPQKLLSLTFGASTSTNTGSISVAPEAENTSLTFQNGANWAGTVYAENVTLDHSTTPVSAAFGKLVLNSDFSLMISESGADSLTIGAGGFEGNGKLVFSGAGNYDYSGLDSITIGSAPLDTKLPAFSNTRGMSLLLEKRDDHSGIGNLLLKRLGITIILY